MNSFDKPGKLYKCTDGVIAETMMWLKKVSNNDSRDVFTKTS